MFALRLFIACGNDYGSNAEGAGGSAAGGSAATARSASGGASTGTGGSTVAGAAGADDQGGSGGAGDTNGSGGSAANADSGGNAGTGGGGGSSAGSGGNEHEPVVCTESGWKCADNFAAYCSENDAGDWVATETDCGSDSCIQTGDNAACAQDGEADSCVRALPVSASVVVSGSNFAEDFTDQLTQSGLNCAATGDSAPEALFDVELVEGQSVLISEVAELRTDADTSINAVFSVMEACTETAVCPLSGGLDDAAGILYTAGFDQTVTLSVSTRESDGGSYEIHIDFPPSLGTLGIGEHPPEAKGSSLGAGEWQSFVVHTTETLMLSGTLTSETNADLDLLMFDELGSLWMASLLDGDEHFATLVAAGTQHLSVRSFDASEGFVLSLYTSPYDYRGSFGAGDNLNVDAGGALAEGESYFAIIETLDALKVTGSVTSQGGEPDIWLHDTLGPIVGFREDGPSESFAETLPANLYVVEVQARPGAGDIDDFNLEVSFATATQ